MIFPQLWWILGYEPNGKMCWLKQECVNLFDAMIAIDIWKKKEPGLRYEILEIK